MNLDGRLRFFLLQNVLFADLATSKYVIILQYICIKGSCCTCLITYTYIIKYVLPFQLKTFSSVKRPVSHSIMIGPRGIGNFQMQKNYIEKHFEKYLFLPGNSPIVYRHLKPNKHSGIQTGNKKKTQSRLPFCNISFGFSQCKA